MEGTIIITECNSPYGRYWEFREKETRQLLAEVDKKSKREFDGPLYFVYTPRGGRLYESARRSKKDSAMEFAKKSIREQFSGVDIQFKINVMQYKYKFA